MTNNSDRAAQAAGTVPSPPPPLEHPEWTARRRLGAISELAHQMGVSLSDGVHPHVAAIDDHVLAVLEFLNMPTPDEPQVEMCPRCEGCGCYPGCSGDHLGGCCTRCGGTGTIRKLARPQGELSYTVCVDGQTLSRSVPMDTEHDAKIAADVLEQILKEKATP